MRKLLVALIAAFALFSGACGASGDGDAADSSTTEASSSTTADTPETTGGSEADETTTTYDGSGPGSGDLVAVEVWADGFCGSFEGWLNGVNTLAEGLQSAIVPGDLEGAKTAIVGLFTDVSSLTGTMIDEVDALGAPDIDDGESFHEALLGKFEEFRASIETARGQAEAASTADPATFQTTISDLVATFQAETQSVGNSFSELDSQYGDAALDAAMSDSCSFM